MVPNASKANKAKRIKPKEEGKENKAKRIRQRE
jgi:hypothetical protein